jgi:hypothetical protein
MGSTRLPAKRKEETKRGNENMRKQEYEEREP